MATSRTHPIARKDLVISELPGEGVIYNFADHQAHCVSEIALRVLQRCDGKTPIAKIATALRKEGQDVTEAQAWQAVGELDRAGLVEIPPQRLVDAGRRRALKQLGLTTGLSVAVPMVWSIVAPSVAQAASVVCVVMMNGCVAGAMGNDGVFCGMMGGGIAGTCTVGVCIPNGNTCI